MTRILYRVDASHVPRGGHKVTFRHIEVLRGGGYDARAMLPGGGVVPGWFEHSIPSVGDDDVERDDIVVVAEGNRSNLIRHAGSDNKKVVFCQNHFIAAAHGLSQLPAEILARYDDYMACSDTVARWLHRFVPHRSIEVVSAFADERRFRPGTKSNVIALMPSKRELEWLAILGQIKRLHRGSAWRVVTIAGKTEAEVASILAEAAIFVSLNRLEGLGMSTLEAMASGCFVVGFKGIGGAEYATAKNGFWVDDDDCEACADALLRAMALCSEGRSRVEAIVSAACDTAERYSFDRFERQLLSFWKTRVPTPGNLTRPTSPQAAHLTRN